MAHEEMNDELRALRVLLTSPWLKRQVWSSGDAGLTLHLDLEGVDPRVLTPEKALDLVEVLVTDRQRRGEIIRWLREEVKALRAQLGK